jgi:hypothetical protein
MPKPVTAPKEDKVLRTGTKNARRFYEMATWGCSIICINLVPFHDLQTDGDETEKRPSCPPYQMSQKLFMIVEIISGTQHKILSIQKRIHNEAQKHPGSRNKNPESAGTSNSSSCSRLECKMSIIQLEEKRDDLW